MTTTSTNRKNEFTTNGVTVDFAFTFAAQSEGQIKALTVDVDGNETDYTNFTIVFNPSSEGGTFTTGDVLDDVDLVVYRETPLTQETDYVKGGRFPADSHEAALDKLTQQNQEQEEVLDRTLKYSIGTEPGDVLSLEEYDQTVDQRDAETLLAANQYTDQQVIGAGVITPDNIGNFTYGKNLITPNSNFDLPGDPSQPVDATPRDYAPGFEIRQGWFTGDDYGAEQLKYEDGKIIFPQSGNPSFPNTIYFIVPKSADLQYVEEVAASIAIDSDGAPLQDTNITYEDLGDRWKVILTGGTYFSAKLEQGDKATKHEVEAYQELITFNTVAEMVRSGAPIGSKVITYAFNSEVTCTWSIIESQGDSFGVAISGGFAELVYSGGGVLEFGAYSGLTGDSSDAIISMHSDLGYIDTSGADISYDKQINLPSSVKVFGGGSISLNYNVVSSWSLSAIGGIESDGVDYNIMGNLDDSIMLLSVGIQPIISNATLSNHNTGGIFVSGNGALTAVETNGCLGDMLIDNVFSDGGGVIVRSNGTEEWSKPANTDSSATFKNSNIESEIFSYILKGFHDTHVHGNRFKCTTHESHEFFSQDTGLENTFANGGGVTIDGNFFTTSGGGSGMITAYVLTPGVRYRVYFDVVVSNSTFDLYNGTSSGVLIDSNLSSGSYVYEFVCTSDPFIYFKADAAQTVSFEKLRIYAESNSQSSFVQDTYSYRSNDNEWVGYERGPTAGIDTLTVKIHDETIRDAWIRAIAVDTERLDHPSWDSAYPDSKADIHDNKCFDSGRGIYATCRNVQIKDNFFDNCSASGDFTSIPSTIRVNTEDYGSSDDANVIIDGNEFKRQGVRRCVTAFKGTISLGENKHDSLAIEPYLCDNNSGAKFKGLRPKSDLNVKVSDFPIVVGRDTYVVTYATTGTFLEISVPNSGNQSCQGARFTVAFTGVVGDIRFKGSSGNSSVNGALLSVVPSGTRVAELICVNAANDFIVTYR